MGKFDGFPFAPEHTNKHVGRNKTAFQTFGTARKVKPDSKARIIETPEDVVRELVAERVTKIEDALPNSLDVTEKALPNSVTKKKRGRKPSGNRALTPAEKQKAYRARKKGDR